MIAPQATTASGAAADRTGAEPRGGPPADEPLTLHLHRLRDAGLAWLAVARERAVLRAKRMALLAALGAAGALAAGAAVATAVFLLLAGLAAWIETALGWPSGTGAMLVGGGLIVLLAIGLVVGATALRRRWDAAALARQAPRGEAR